MNQTSLVKVVRCVRRLVAAGYPRERAILAVYAAWGLTPEQVTVVSRLA